MTQFQEDLAKILVDKLLLGVIAALFGFYLSRLLENHRARNSYIHTQALQRAEASRTMTTLMEEEHRRILGIRDMLERIAAKHLACENISEEDVRAGFDYVAQQDATKARMISLAMTLHPIVMIALTNYLRESNKLFDAIRGNFRAAAPFPTREVLNSKMHQLLLACSFVATRSPFEKVSNEDLKAFKELSGVDPVTLETAAEPLGRR
jgi:hypothetical protein